MRGLLGRLRRINEMAESEKITVWGIHTQDDKLYTFALDYVTLSAVAKRTK